MSVCVIITILNYIVDPYNIFDNRVFGNKLLKPEAKVQERVTKIIGLKLCKKKIETIFLGTSRVDLGINADYYKKLTGKNAQNLAMGDMRLFEIKDLLDISLKIHPEIKNIYFGTDYAKFVTDNTQNNDNRAEITQNPKIISQDLGLAFLSFQSTGNSIWTLIKNGLGIGKRMFYPSGVKHIFVNKKIDGEFVKSTQEYKDKLTDVSINKNDMLLLKNIYKDSQKAGMNMYFFIMPTHISDINNIYETGQWENFQNWKKQLVLIAPVVDFDYPNYITTDPIRPDMQTFFDGSHSTHIVGDMILDKIVLNKGNFGRNINPQNIDYYNDLDTKELLKWRKENIKIDRNVRG